MYMGIDPDSRNTAIAIITKDKIYAVYMIKRKDKKIKEDGVISMGRCINEFFKKVYIPWHEIHMTALESQEMYIHAGIGNSKNPSSLLVLSQVTGALLANIESKEITMPIPKRWKGQVPKHIHHCRVFSELGLESFTSDGSYGIPNVEYDYIGKEDINPSDWRHLGDAVGLALFAKKEFFKAAQRRAFLNNLP